MKNLILTLALTLSLTIGFSNTFASVNDNNPAQTESSSNRIYIKVYEDGAIWVYVYEEDGTFVNKYIENNY
jgi:hypothetical protein